MSEVMSSQEIDRVLDNIRKLVSTEPRNADGAGKLVLTSDLRVAGDAVDPEVDLPPAAEVVTRRDDTAQTLETRIAGLEAAISRDDEFEPDGSEAQEQHRPDTIPTFTRATSATGRGKSGAADTDDEGDAQGASELRFFHTPTEPVFAAGGFVPNEDPLRLDDAEELLDEEALRELVAEVVREELAGALGERITRNVRKLVRREVMRALSMREFE